jgi:hypothetical protein
MKMRVEIQATNDGLPMFLARLNPHRDTYRQWKISLNKHIKDYKSKAHFEAHKRPGDSISFFVDPLKGSFFISILISAFPSVGVKPYHGTITVDGREYKFRNVDAYHEAIIKVLVKKKAKRRN